MVYGTSDSFGGDGPIGWDDDLLFDNPEEDPFGLPVVSPADDEGVGESTFSRPAGDTPSGTIGAVSYDRGNNEIVGVPTSLDGDNGVRPGRPTRAERATAERVRDRERTDTGHRNVRRAAGSHSGESGEGEAGESSGGSSTPATSIESAASRLRDSIAHHPSNGMGTGLTLTAVDEIPEIHGGRPPMVDTEADGFAEYMKTMGAGRAPTRINSARGFERTFSHPEVDFSSAEFDCEVYACKMNAAGDWLVTFKVPFAYRTTVAELSGAAGLNLHTRMEVDGFA